jgi:hypothetical protein
MGRWLTQKRIRNLTQDGEMGATLGTTRAMPKKEGKMGLFDNETAEEKLIRSLKFVKVATTHNGGPSNIQHSGYLTDVSVAMILVEIKRQGLKLST